MENCTLGPMLIVWLPAPALGVPGHFWEKSQVCNATPFLASHVLGCVLCDDLVKGGAGWWSSPGEQGCPGVPHQEKGSVWRSSRGGSTGMPCMLPAAGQLASLALQDGPGCLQCMLLAQPLTQVWQVPPLSLPFSA